MAIAGITTALLSGALPAGRAVTASTVVASFVVLVFGEIVPKSYGLANAREWALTARARSPRSGGSPPRSSSSSTC